jgi:hypothetical protein
MIGDMLWIDLTCCIVGVVHRFGKSLPFWRHAGILKEGGSYVNYENRRTNSC